MNGKMSLGVGKGEQKAPGNRVAGPVSQQHRLSVLTNILVHCGSPTHRHRHPSQYSLDKNLYGNGCDRIVSQKRTLPETVISDASARRISPGLQRDGIKTGTRSSLHYGAMK